MKKFKTESKKLLDLMANSIYTNKEIFLRELISNASDALDKLWMYALTNKDKSISRNDLKIEISFDEKSRILTISDNGIGMTKDELDANLGTIAHSGSLEFKENQQETNDKKSKSEIDIIGQFGVGFYSAFMVADKVKVVTKAYNSKDAYVWSSNGVEGYNIEDATRDSYGTDVILHIRKSTDDVDFDQYLSQYSLKSLIKKYSDYVRYPICMDITEHLPKEKPQDSPQDAEVEYEEVTTNEVINSMKPIWQRSKSSVKEEEYNEFFRTQFHEYSDPEHVISLHAEGSLNYDVLLFIPSNAPQDLYSKDFQRGLALYSSSVLIMDKCADLLPECFGFVKGVVDSPDLNLNISREMLQQDRQLTAIARKIEKKIKTELLKIRDNEREKYEKIYKNFGHSFKFSIYSSYGMQAELLSDLLLFYSAKEKKLISLDEYVDNLATDQNDIYFATGDSYEKLSAAPSVKTVLAKDVDVLLCQDTVDEFCLTALHQYKEKEIKNVSSEDVDLETQEEKDKAKKIDEKNEDLFKTMCKSLGEHVTKVVSSSVLSGVPAAVSSEGAISLSMEKYLSSVPGNEDAPKASHVLELNPKHAIFKVLQKAHEDGDKTKVKDYSYILYCQALMAEGLDIPDAAKYNKLVCKLMN